MGTADVVQMPTVLRLVPEPRGSAPTLSAPERDLIRVRSIYLCASSIMTIFLGLYLFHVGGIGTVASFYSAYFTFVTVGFVVAGRMLRTAATRTVMRSGMVFLCVVYLLLVLLGPAAATYALVMGALAGTGEGLFWAGQNLTEYRVSRPGTRDLYLGRAEFAGQMVATLGPPLAGVVVTVAALLLPGEGRYYLLFGLLTLVLLVARRAAVHLRPIGGLRFELPDVGRGLDLPGWWAVLGQNVVRGMWQTATGIFAPIVVYLVVRGELAVSVYAAITTLLSGCAALIAGRVLHRRPGAYVVGVVSVPVGLLALAWGHSALAIAAYVLFVSCLDHFARIAGARAAYTLMDAAGDGDGADYHRFVQREIALNGGRVLAFVLILLLATQMEQMAAVSFGIAAVAVLPAVGGVLQARIERRASAAAALIEHSAPEQALAAA